jgi:hypothetical protein
MVMSQIHSPLKVPDSCLQRVVKWTLRDVSALNADCLDKRC